MTRDTAERARELAQWVHEKLCCAQNLPWEEGDICDDCLESAKTELMPMLTKIQAEAREHLAAWMIAHSFSTGHGDTFEDLLKELDWQVKELRQNAAKAQLEEAKKWKPLECQQESHHPLRLPICRTCQKMARWEERIAALAQALQPEEKEET